MNVLLLVCVSAAFYLAGAAKKPKVIDYQNQKGGDILNLRKDMEPKVIDHQNQRGGNIWSLRNDIHARMRNAIRPRSTMKWTQQPDNSGNFIIPYIISGKYKREEKRLIFEAMKKLSLNTCVRFKERDDEEYYAEIRNKKGDGCFSNIGRSHARVSVVQLEANDEGTCMEPETVMHELMHLIGLWHEHSRNDRDDYITVHLENVEQGEEDYTRQFAKLSPYQASTYGIPYDYTSIMHYAKDFFAKPGTITMETLDASYQIYEQDIIGTATEPSESDYKKICLMYNCEYCMGEKMSHQQITEPMPRPASVSTPAPLPQIPGCIDENPFYCKTMKKQQMLNCLHSYDAIYCCSTCNAVEEPLLSTPYEEPLSNQKPSRRCYDKYPQRCKELKRNEELNCGSKLTRSRCCRTCRF